MKYRLLAICILISGFGSQSLAQGDLLVTPTRVVFEGKKQKEALNLVNMGKDTARYALSFINYNMNEDGSFESIEKPDSGQLFATPYLRIFPRRVSLAPGEPQVIMLQYRRRANMVSGEYRSHLYFRAEKRIDPLGTVKKDTSNLTIQLIPVYGVSIPIIIRSGIVDVGSSLTNLSMGIQPNMEQYLKLTINRTGNISIYGDIVIEYIPTQGKSMVIGGVKGVGVYTNISKRNLVVKLSNSTGQPFSNGKVLVQFISKGEAKQIVYAESELNL
ncbi:MAG: hypothetical protein R6U66_11555 [Bacteroidales bacterium]